MIAANVAIEQVQRLRQHGVRGVPLLYLEPRRIGLCDLPCVGHTGRASAKRGWPDAAALAPRRGAFTALLKQRVVIFDGAMGTMIQRASLQRGTIPRRAIQRLAQRSARQQRSAEHHAAARSSRTFIAPYLDAGADVISTNTFNSTSVSQADYGMQALVGELNLEAARLARQVADEVTARDAACSASSPERLGPTSRTASLSPDVNDPGFRNISFDELVAAYSRRHARADRGRRRYDFDRDDVRHLERQGGAVRGAPGVRRGRRRSCPSSSPARSPMPPAAPCPGQTTEAFWNSIRHAQPAGRGTELRARAASSCDPTSRSSRASRTPTCAPIPTPGCRTPSASTTRRRRRPPRSLREFAASGFVNMVGGCCGTTPEHIRAIVRAVAGLAPRAIAAASRAPAA